MVLNANKLQVFFFDDQQIRTDVQRKEVQFIGY